MSASSSRSPVAFMSVKTQFDNLGDVLINRELALALSARARTVIDFSRCPPAFRQAMAVEGLLNIEVVDGLGSLKLFIALISARLRGQPCYYFLNPGGLGGREMSPRQTLSASIYNVLLWFFAVIGVRVCLVGASFDPMQKRARFVMKTRLRNLFLIAVRDQLSIGHLRDDGVRVDGLVPDLSFLAFQPERLPAGDRPALAFSFRFDKGDETTFDAFVLDIAGRQAPGRVLKFVAQVARDGEPMQRLAERVAAHGFEARYVGCWTDIDQVNQSYADCSAIYSNRLHALLMATYVGAAPVAVVSGKANRKIEGIFGDLGLSDNLHRLGDAVSASVEQPRAAPKSLLLKEKSTVNRFFDRLFEGRARPEILKDD